jgi:hypothetical protein
MYFDVEYIFSDMDYEAMNKYNFKRTVNNAAIEFFRPITTAYRFWKSRDEEQKTMLCLYVIMGLITASALAAIAINVNLLWYL